ncbi:MAG TPA: hypothetical protein P5044_07165, partial [bacterium]|nr:hypothetical protein [bacterium]
CDPSEDIDGDSNCLVSDCRGTDGKDGADGADGEDGTDGTNGTNGTNGTDGEDGEDGEDGTNGTNGTNGTDGTDGLNSAMKVSDEPAGENCPDGGKKIETGVDLNGDAVLQEDEVQSTSFICNGEDGAPGTDGTDGINGKNGSGCSMTAVGNSEEPFSVILLFALIMFLLEIYRFPTKLVK